MGKNCPSTMLVDGYIEDIAADMKDTQRQDQLP